MVEILQLNPLAKTLLLKHRINVQKQEYGEDGTALPFADEYRSKLFKFLSISKSFLRLSQREPVYELSVGRYTEDTGLFMLGFFQDSDCAEVELPFDQAYQLIDFLRPRKFDIHLDCIERYATMQKVKQFLSLSNGKITLMSRSGKKTAAFIDILIKNHERICGVECIADVLAQAQLIPRLKLEYCQLNKLNGYDQLDAVLKNHEIGKLDLRFNYKYEKDYFRLRDLDNFSANSTVTSLKLLYNWDKDDLLMQKTEKLISYFCNLKSIVMEVGPKREHIQFDNETVYDQIITLYNSCRQIEASCSLNTKLKFDFTLDFILNNVSDYLTDWLTQLKGHEAFAGAENPKFEVCPARQFFQFEHKIKDENFEFCISFDVSHWFTGPPPIDAYDRLEY